MRDMLFMLCVSKKCKIPKAWKTEIRYAIKHSPSPWDVKINGEPFAASINHRDIDDIIKMVDIIDKSCEVKRAKNLTKKKKR